MGLFGWSYDTIIFFVMLHDFFIHFGILFVGYLCLSGFSHFFDLLNEGRIIISFFQKLGY